MFVVSSTVKNKNEEEYFKEVMQQDDTGVILLKRLSGSELPIFYTPVRIIWFLYHCFKI